jgi:hypothetical protein
MKLFLLIFLFTPLITFSQSQCEYGNVFVEVGRSVWVADPILVNRFKQVAIKKGWTPLKIDYEVSNNAGLGYRLTCTYIYEPTNEVEKPGDVLKVAGVALVLNTPSDDFYRSVLRHE